ncbi:MAG: hypothetical protein GY816_12335 [Cytophagales bacterium]|nr:hypothetical protein [Cytophagales bacterium]
MEITIEDLQPYLESLSHKRKEKLLYQSLKKDKALMEKLYFKHISTADQLDARYDSFKEKVAEVIFSSHQSMTDELGMAKAIGEAKKVINEFTKIDKRPEREIDLLMTILEAVFDVPGNLAEFGTCWTKYDLSVTQTLKRVISIIQNKLHEDFHLNYKEKTDRYLIRLKSGSSFNDFVYDLPDEL